MMIRYLRYSRVSAAGQSDATHSTISRLAAARRRRPSALDMMSGA